MSSLENYYLGIIKFDTLSIYIIVCDLTTRQRTTIRLSVIYPTENVITFLLM
jgi:hypothetical protein